MLDRQRIKTFLLGGAVGALVGLLLAPRSGRELRGTFADRAGEARERGRETYFETQERMRERIAERREDGVHRTADVEPESDRAAGSHPARAPGEPGPTPLRDVSGDSSMEEEGGSDDLRERIRATRARLRASLGESSGSGEGRKNDGA